MKRFHLIGAGLLAALALAGCAGMQNRPNSVTTGATYVNDVRNTGSYGNQNIQARTRVGGERVWQGKKVFVYERPGHPQGDIFTEPDTGRWIAFVKGDSPLISFDPALGWNWPLTVGETWTRKHRFTNHATKQTTDFTGTWKVEAYEAVTVPAGTFQAYKIFYTDTLGVEDITWWSPDVGVGVKGSTRRPAKHPAGPGTTVRELLSRPTMP